MYQLCKYMELFVLRVGKKTYLYTAMTGMFIMALLTWHGTKENKIPVSVVSDSVISNEDESVSNRINKPVTDVAGEKDNQTETVTDSDVFADESVPPQSEPIPWTEIELSEFIIREQFMSLEKLSYFDVDKIDRYQEYILANEDKTYKQCVIEVNIGLDKGFFTDAKEVENPDDLLVLVNKFHNLPSDYEPADLVVLPEEYAKEGIMLREVAANAFDKMRTEALAEGYEINVVSAYRSYATQEKLYNSYAARSGDKEADSYSARPGYSEHQTGLALDLQAGAYKYNEFSKTPESKYVAEHAHEYGFILRYQKGKRYITGYIPEAWHIRYVGVEVATIIYEEGLTYEEYCVIYGN
ncbi:MAG: M15 family metallopeptidase [Lachnospiraceae bacterium]|nr:M15 family metallopeptidase [Lachnospiraceae bacterium]